MAWLPLASHGCPAGEGLRDSGLLTASPSLLFRHQTPQDRRRVQGKGSWSSASASPDSRSRSTSTDTSSVTVTKHHRSVSGCYTGTLRALEASGHSEAAGSRAGRRPTGRSSDV